MLRTNVLVGLVASLLIGGAFLFLWFLFCLKPLPTRAITSEEHDRCAASPRGDMVLEYQRQACFDELYSQPFKVPQ